MSPSYLPIIEDSAVTLNRYAEIIGVEECAFWGINDGQGGGSCRSIWTLSQRKLIARYLAEAQDEIEKLIGYPIGAQWIVEKRKTFKCPDLARMGFVIQGGIKAQSTIQNGAVPNYATDPAVIGPLPTTVTNEEEIVIYHPGTQIKIEPLTVTIAGGNVTIEIPWCRMVSIAYLNNPEVGWNYADVATWGEATVDVVRVYNDPSTQAVLSKNHNCSLNCSAQGCIAYTDTGCIYVKDETIGALEIFLATFSGGAWHRKSHTGLCCDHYREVKLHYQAGDVLTLQAEDAIVRLAHSKMPQEPCGCDPVRQVWARDRNVPDINTKERMNCPFGINDGAWMAYLFAKSMKLWRGSITSGSGG